MYWILMFCQQILFLSKKSKKRLELLRRKNKTFIFAKQSYRIASQIWG